MPNSISLAGTVSSANTNISFNSTQLIFSNGGSYYIQMGFHFSDPTSSTKIYGYAFDAQTQQVLAGTGGYTYGGYNHAETFSTSFIIDASQQVNLEFKACLLTNYFSLNETWPYLVVNAVKIS